MKNYNDQHNHLHQHSNTSRIWSGLIILVVGLVFLLKNLGLYIPDWVVSWPMLLIIIGLLVGYKRRFNGGGWLVLLLIGGFFMTERVTDYDFSKYYFAIAFIVIGLFLIFKPKSRKKEVWIAKWKDKFDDKTDNDILDSVNVFGGSHQYVYSKNFKGGDVTAIFGGSDINLTQADFNDTVTLDLVAIFGGVKIIIPPDWEVKSEVTAIFGGIDDKRAAAQLGVGPRKILVLKGVALFGGVDIRNF